MKENCKLCGSSVFEKYLEHRGYRYFRCKNCSLVQLLPMPTDEELKEALKEEWQEEFME